MEGEREVLEVLRETELGSFGERLVGELQLSRLEHFEHVEDAELEAAGLSLPAVRRLRAAIEKRRRPKFRSLFKGSIGGSFRGSEKSSQSRARVGAESEASTSAAAPVTCLISKEQLKMMEKVGEGSFAVVKRAVWHRGGGKRLDVAVKVLRDGAGLGEETELEVEHMHRLRHPNLIRLYGLVFASPVMMVVELCEGGSLLDRLRCQDKPRPLALTLMDWAVQVARGMAYLESMRFIHRDLAARNCLLSANEAQLKIGDFGLMRALPDKDEHYVMQRQRKVPFAWCPPESLKRRQFSHASDVWSFGVTLWEMLSYGEEPWLGFRGPDILKKVEAGERLQRPQLCSASLHALLSHCWALLPEHRPKFPQLKVALKEIRDQEMGTGNAKLPQTEDPERGLLGLSPGEPVVLIEALAEQSLWLGQSATSRKVGLFPQTHFRFLDDARGEAAHPKGQSRRISKPIKSSFIHAGHGDAGGGESWGQPDRIDPLILQNPMPLIDLGAPEPNAHLGAEVVESIRGMGASRGRSKTGPQGSGREPQATSSRQQDSPTSSEVDPFAPFDEYGSLYAAQPAEGGASNGGPRSKDSRGGNYYAMPPSTYYGQVGASAASSAPQHKASSSDSSVPEDPALPLPAPTPVALRGQRNALPPPQAVLKPSVPQAHSGVLPPPPASTPRSPLSARSPSSAVPRPLSTAPSRASDPTSLPIPTSSASLTTPLSSEWLARNLAAASQAHPPSATLGTGSGGSVPDLSSTGPDPFEVPATALSLLQKPRYDHMFKGPATPGTIGRSPSPLPPTNVPAVAVQPRPQSEVPFAATAPRPASALLPAAAPAPASAAQQRHSMFPGTSPGTAVGSGADAMVEELMARINRMDAAVASIEEPSRQAPLSVATGSSLSAQQPNPAPVMLHSPGSLANTNPPLRPRPHANAVPMPGLAVLQPSSRAVSVPSVADVSLLEQFDPLSASHGAAGRPSGRPGGSAIGRPAPRTQASSSAEGAVSDDLLNAVLAECPFASVPRATLKLKRCGLRPGEAVEELKVEKLVDMGLAGGANAAKAALLKAAWDLNTAAAALLE